MEVPPEKPATVRLLSLDTYRGLVMFCLAATGFGIAKAIGKEPANDFLALVKFNVGHPEWNSQFKVIGFSLWDMIQPAFMFMVGVSMPYSYAKRQKLGESFGKQLRHAWVRALILVLLGVFLQSLRRPDTHWLFTNVLSQIGLGYGFLFFLVGKNFKFQAIVGAAILIAYYLLMIAFPAGLGSYAQHFENTTSMPQRFDLWFLNLFPRDKPFDGHSYSTLNFVPALVTMLMGVICGQLLKRGDLSEATKVKRLLFGGAICLVVGAGLGLTICPVVKKLWTPSWTLFSGAYVVWLLAILYWVVDVKGWSRWTFPFVIVGLNPITMYFMSMTIRGWVSKNLRTHLPDFLYAPSTGHIVDACLVVGFYWLILLWMYRNRVFVRI